MTSTECGGLQVPHMYHPQTFELLSAYTAITMPRILLIDDLVELRALLRRVLTRHAYDVLEAPDGKIGLALCRDQRPDLVIVDMYMPVMDGIEFMQAARKEFPTLPFLAVSGGGRIDSMTPLEVAQHFGATILQKPFRQHALLAAVANALRMSPDGS